MSQDFEWAGILLACGLLGLMFLVPTVVIVRDVRRADREAAREAARVAAQEAEHPVR